MYLLNVRFIKVLSCIGLLVGLSGCLRLDDNLFNQNTIKITRYSLDEYTGNVDFQLDPSYKIPDNLIHLFTLESKAPEESAGTTIYALYIGNPDRIATDTVIMYCHGNRDHMDFYWQRAKLLANAGKKNRFGVLMVDYRGFGLSAGKPTENGLYADVDAGLQWLKNKGLTDNRLIIYGFSVGSAPATKLCVEPRTMKPRKLLLEAPFASSAVMVKDGSALLMPKAFFTDVEVNNAALIKQVTQPLFWIHGEADSFLNIDTHGKMVYNNYGGSYKEGHRIPHAEHGSIPNTMGFENYLQCITDFITKH